MKGVILAGGLGTRLRPLSNYIPKPMIPIGKKEKPLLEYIIKLFRRNDVKDLIIIGSYKIYQIKNYFGDGSRFGVKISYVEDKQEGTAGCILRACHLVDKDFIVYYGDILSNINLKNMVKFHKKRKCIATIAVSSNVPVEVGVVKVENSKVVSFIEKPKIKLYTNIAIYVVKERIIEYIRELKGRKNKVDFAKDVFPYVLRKGEEIAAYVTNCYWNDIGNLAKYEKLNHEEISKIFSWVEEE